MESTPWSKNRPKSKGHFHTPRFWVDEFLIWLVVSTPLKNMTSSVLKMIIPYSSQLNGKKTCSKPPTSFESWEYPIHQLSRRHLWLPRRAQTEMTAAGIILGESPNMIFSMIKPLFFLFLRDMAHGAIWCHLQFSITAPHVFRSRWAPRVSGDNLQLLLAAMVANSG